ncbi:UNVERIFIED_CONTAM: Threonine aldolase [Siphonaria sp. JEL0065]|nr:Threonine aldolase [Siphonaria sp. JEL0065]
MLSQIQRSFSRNRSLSVTAAAGSPKANASTAMSAGVVSMYTGGDIQAKVPESLLVADLRSDTVTTPTLEMRQAMANAPVGDDVFGDDPTIQRLETLAANLSGHESALFCASGTMTNQLGIRTLLTSPPHSVITDSRAHIYCYEASGVAHHSQALVIPVSPATGKNHLTADIIARHMIVDDDVHHAPTRVICLENTLGGEVREIFPFDELVKIRTLAKQYGIFMHLDGARLWNSSAATGISIKEYCSLFDTVSLCLSKGLGAPIGSVLVGSQSNIRKARHYRKMFGGGWRQGGILAAAAIVAIEKQFPSIANDHLTAKYLGEHLVGLGFELTRKVETNMVWFDTSKVGVSGDDLQRVLASKGVRVLGGPAGEQRWVVHHQVSRTSVDVIVQALSEYLKSK